MHSRQFFPDYFIGHLKSDWASKQNAGKKRSDLCASSGALYFKGAPSIIQHYFLADWEIILVMPIHDCLNLIKG